MSVIRVLLADDQALFREGLHTLLSVRADLEVVGEAANGEEAVALAASQRADVVLMDVRMPVLDGVAATRRLHTVQPGQLNLPTTSTFACALHASTHRIFSEVNS